MKSLAKVIGMVALAYLAFEYGSLLCGLGAYFLFCSVCDE